VIAIVGGGITGLAAAFELAERRVPFQLFEASRRAGGIIRTEHVDGFTIEAGPDSMLAQKPAAIELCERLGLGPRLIPMLTPRTAFVLHRERLHPLPSRSILGIPATLRGIAGYGLLPWSARLRLALEPLIPAKRDDADESVGSFFRRRFGDATVGLIAEPLLGGIHAGDIEALSIRSLFPRFVDAETRRGSVLRTLRRTRHPASADGAFKALASGMSEIVTAIERRLPPDSILYGAPVEALSREGEGWTLRVNGAGHRADAVILATPAFVASRLLAGVDDRAASLSAEVPYVSTASVALAWPRDAISHPLAGSGFVVARRTNPLRITACTWVSSKWPARAPEGMALLRVYVGGAADPGAVELDDETLAGIAVRDITSVLPISQPPVLTRVYRWRNAGAQHNVGQAARVASIESRLVHHPGILVAGSGFRSVGIPDCVSDGRAAAAAAAQFAARRNSSSIRE
jgi:oxygen-dependent protoporphyrinogen oxidase